MEAVFVRLNSLYTFFSLQEWATYVWHLALWRWCVSIGVSPSFFFFLEYKKLEGYGWKLRRSETPAAEVKVTFFLVLSRHGQGVGVKAQGNSFLHIAEPPSHSQKKKKMCYFYFLVLCDQLITGMRIWYISKTRFCSICVSVKHWTFISLGCDVTQYQYSTSWMVANKDKRERDICQILLPRNLTR